MSSSFGYQTIKAMNPKKLEFAQESVYGKEGGACLPGIDFTQS